MIVFLPSVASTAMATSLFASLMADSGIIAERFPLGSGSFLTGLKKQYIAMTFLSSASPRGKSFYIHSK